MSSFGLPVSQWVVATAKPGLCSACGAEAAPLYRRWMEFDLHKMYCADCTVGQDPTYEEVMR